MDKLKQLGDSALLFKIDISRAFRHLRIDPGDLDLLGLKQESYYVDGTLGSDFGTGPYFFRGVCRTVYYGSQIRLSELAELY